MEKTHSQKQEKLKYIKNKYSDIIYQDIKEWIYNHDIFKKYYNVVSKYDIISQHIDVQNSLNENGDCSNYSQLIRFILDLNSQVLNNREENYQKILYKDIYILRKRPWINEECLKYFKTLKLISTSTVVTFLFDIITEKNLIYETRLMCKKRPGLSMIIADKLLHFKNVEYIECKKWKGSEYYYKKIFYKSIIHHDRVFDYNILKLKYDVNFDNMICGHPKASHGWVQEDWLEIQNIYKYYYENNSII